MVAVPAATPVTTPAATVAIEVLLDTQVSPPTPVQVVLLPAHILVRPPEIEVGVLLVTVAVPLLLQPPVVPVTVYMVVADGDAVTVVPTVADKPVAGIHT